jgi:hypothetical protein
MKKLYALLATLALLVVGVSAQSTNTDTWTNVPGSGTCQTTVKAPSYYCFVSVNETSGTSTLWFYVTVQPDGTFTNGQINKSPLYNYPPSFNAVNWTGSFLNNTFTGTFSGTQPDGTPFTGDATETLGLVRRCAGRYGCHFVTGPVSGSGTATYGQ